MKSMTGYGKGVSSEDSRTVTIEIKSVNNRFLEINSKTPKSLMCVDDVIQKKIKQVISRGSVEVYITYTNTAGSSKTVAVDKALATEYVKAAKTVRTEFMLDDDFNVTALLRSPEVLSVTNTGDDSETIIRLAQQATAAALENLEKMRIKEGAAINADLSAIIGNLKSLLAKVIERAPKVVSEYKTNLAARVKLLLDGYELDETKVINEVAFFADKADINEEIQRLTSHITQFCAICGEDIPQGRRLDFLSQEMVREVNTMGSKSNDLKLVEFVLAMKNEVEKLKEQIRNVE